MAVNDALGVAINTSLIYRHHGNGFCCQIPGNQFPTFVSRNETFRGSNPVVQRYSQYFVQSTTPDDELPAGSPYKV